MRKHFLLLLFCLPAFAANQRYSNWCMNGGVLVNTPPKLSTAPFMASYKGCTVTVYVSGSLTLATIFSDANNTPQPNPFTANTVNGSFYFYAADGRYDVTLSGGGLPAPFTIGDVLLNTSSGGGGGGGTGTVTSVALAVPSWLSVSGSPIIAAGTLTIAAAGGQTTHQVIGTSTGTSFAPVTLATADLPYSYSGNTTELATVTGAVTNAHVAVWDASGNLKDGGSPGSGTVTSVAQTVPSWLSVAGSPITTSGTLAITAATGQPSHQVIGTFTGTSVSLGALAVADLPFTYTNSGNTKLATSSGALTNGHCIQANASGDLIDAGGACTTAAGTVTSVALTVPSWLTVAGSPITSAGTLAVTAAGAQTSHQVIGTGSGSTYGPVTLATADLPFTYSGNTTKLATTTGALTNGHCVSIDANGNIVDNGGTCGTGAGGGTVTSVAMTVPTGFQLTGSPIATSGTLALSMPSSWTTGDLLLGNGANSVARLGIGGNNTCLTSNGTTASWGACGGAGGTVTSVGLSFPGFTVTGSPVTGSGTLTVTNPLTTEGDLPYFSSSAWTRLGIGLSGKCLTSNGTDPVWGNCGGSVSSVAFSAPAGFGISGSPIVTSGTIGLTMPTGWTAGDLLLGNGSQSVSRLGIGSNGQALLSNGTTALWGSVGTVTQVGLSLPAMFSVSGSPVTTTGTLSATLTNQNGHLFFGNNTGASAVPGFVSIGTSDLPFSYTNNANTKLATSVGGLTNGHCIVANASGDLVDSGSSCGAGYTPGTGIAIAGNTISLDTTVALTQSQAQVMTPWLAVDVAASSTTTYVATITPAIIAYQDKMEVRFWPGLSCAGGTTTLNLNSVGAVPIFKANGTTTLSANDCRVNQPLVLDYSAKLNGGAGAWVIVGGLGN